MSRNAGARGELRGLMQLISTRYTGVRITPCLTYGKLRVIQRETWCMEPYAGVDYITFPYVDSTRSMGDPRHYSPLRD
jgi:hypothetical protein